MDYAKNRERCCFEKTSVVQRTFIDILSRRAREQGQKSHKTWSLKYVIDEFIGGQIAFDRDALASESGIERGMDELYLSPVTRWLMRLHRFYPPLAKLR